MLGWRVQFDHHILWVLGTFQTVFTARAHSDHDHSRCLMYIEQRVNLDRIQPTCTNAFPNACRHAKT